MVNPNSKFLQKSTLDTPKILINDSMMCFLTFTKKKTRRSASSQSSSIIAEGKASVSCITCADRKHWEGKDAFKKPALISATTVRRKAVTMMIMIVMIVMMKQKIHCLMLACVTNVTLRRGGDTKA